jgi:hypothetical protein
VGRWAARQRLFQAIFTSGGAGDLLKGSGWLPGTDENANYEFSISLLPATPNPAKMRKRDRDRAEARRCTQTPSSRAPISAAQAVSRE